jgi:F-type H+-transporting ATPase subunit delta
MSDAGLLYAEVLLTAAKNQNILTAVAEEMKALSLGFSGYAKMFSSPVFPVREQLAAVDAVLDDKFQPLTKRFICLLVSMRRLGEIEQIAETYDEIARREAGQVDLHMTVYDEPAPEMIPDLVSAACEKGLFSPVYRENINIRFTADKSILGGFIADCDGKSWDCSLRTRLAEISKMIRKV